MKQAKKKKKGKLLLSQRRSQVRGLFSFTLRSTYHRRCWFSSLRNNKRKESALPRIRNAHVQLSIKVARKQTLTWKETKREREKEKFFNEFEILLRGSDWMNVMRIWRYFWLVIANYLFFLLSIPLWIWIIFNKYLWNCFFLELSCIWINVKMKYIINCSLNQQKQILGNTFWGKLLTKKFLFLHSKKQRKF